MSDKFPRPKHILKDGVSAIVRMPNGDLVSIDDLISREKAMNAVEFPLSALKEEDLVVATWEDADYRASSFSFRMKQSHWSGLLMGHSFAPSKSWDVEIQNGLPHANSPTSAHFIGSGFGGSMLSPNTLMTDRSLVFGLKDGREWRTNYIRNLKVLRRDGDAYTVLTAPEKAERDAAIEAIHGARLKQFEQLLRHCNLPNTHSQDTAPSKDGSGYEDEQLVARFSDGKAMGQTLDLFDKQRSRWVSYKYFNWKKEDILQVAYADVDPALFKKESALGAEPYLALGIDAVHRTNGWVATYTTGPAQKLQALAYHVSDLDAHDALHIPRRGLMQPAPTIEFVNDEPPRIPRGYPLSIALNEDPALMQNMLAKIALEKTGSGTALLHIGDERRTILTPEHVFAELSLR